MPKAVKCILSWEGKESQANAAANAYGGVVGITCGSPFGGDFPG